LNNSEKKIYNQQGIGYFGGPVVAAAAGNDGAKMRDMKQWEFKGTRVECYLNKFLRLSQECQIQDDK